MPRKYNYIYEMLTGNDDKNLLGLIAYSIYKNDKIDFIQKWREKNPECEDGPDDSMIELFHEESMRRIDQYREMAQNRLTALMNDLVLENLAEYKKAAREGEQEALSEIKDKVSFSFWPFFWQSVGGGLIGNTAFFIFMLIIALVFFNWFIDLGGKLLKLLIG